MGRRAIEWFYRQVHGLDLTLNGILGTASWSCIDDEALLKKTRPWLAEECGTSIRTLERHEPTLAKLELLVRTEEGHYRLPSFWKFDRQNGGPPRQIVRQFVRQNGGAQEEGFLRRELIQGTSNSTSSQTLGPDDDELKIQKIAKRYAIPEAEAYVVFYTGLIRHCELGDGGPIRSVEFFANVITEIGEDLSKGGTRSTEYLAYLKVRADRVRRRRRMEIEAEEVCENETRVR